jgi:hypothetical protein
MHGDSGELARQTPRFLKMVKDPDSSAKFTLHHLRDGTRDTEYAREMDKPSPQHLDEEQKHKDRRAKGTVKIHVHMSRP